MRVIHIIPSAFDYFNDVRASAMKLVESEREVGADSEAYTLQYGSVTSKQKGEMFVKAPSIGFISMNSSTALVDDLKNYDIVHLHTPFLGMAGNILKWKKNNFATPLVVTYWRDVRIYDAMSAFIAVYNRIYLPRFFRLADALIFNDKNSQNKSVAGIRMTKSTKFYYMKELKNMDREGANIHLTMPPDKLKLSEVDMEARACISVYNQLIK